MTIIPFWKLSSSQFLFCHTEIIYEVSLWTVLGISSKDSKGHRLGSRSQTGHLVKESMWPGHFCDFVWLRLQSPAFQPLTPPTLTSQNRKWRNFMFNKNSYQKNCCFALKTQLRLSLLYKSQQQLQFCLPLLPTPNLQSWQSPVPSLWQLADTRS